MMPLRFSRKAEQDLERIGDHIARDNPRRALSFIGELRERCDMLMTQPQIGSHHPEVGKDIRLLVHGQYLIFCRVRSDYVRIERILHGARYLPEAFKK